MSKIVLLSGAPGSGKTTLARELALSLGWPYVGRDAIYGGLRSGDPAVASEQIVARGVALFYSTLSHFGIASCNLIADATLYRGTSEPDVRALSSTGAQIINVHCRTADWFSRFSERERTLTVVESSPKSSVEARIEQAQQASDLFVEPLDLGCELIEVDTTRYEYSPSFASIVRQINGV